MLPNFLGGLKEYLKLSVEDIFSRLHGVRCPTCHGKDVIHWGWYSRNLRTTIEKVRIRVKRMICKNPGCPGFSFLPCFVLAYQHWALSVLESCYAGIVIAGESVNSVLMRTSIEESEKKYCPSFDTLYRMWRKIRHISEKSGDNIYSFGKQLEPDFDPFPNPVYQDLLDRKCSGLSWLKLGLQWSVCRMLSQLSSLKQFGSFSPLSLLHFCGVYPRPCFDLS